MHWGIWRKDPPLLVYGKGWEARAIPMLRDGTLKHLGLKSDMDAANNAQRADCLDNIRTLGEKVTRAISRSRDKCTALGYCVRTNVEYRA